MYPFIFMENLHLRMIDHQSLDLYCLQWRNMFKSYYIGAAAYSLHSLQKIGVYCGDPQILPS